MMPSLSEKGDGKHNLRSSRYIEERRELGPQFTPEVPVEWEAWLRGRRKNPPTEQEIQRNHVKMMQAKLKGKELEKKYLNSDEATETSAVPEITEDITSNSQRVNFPTYDEYEIVPGKKQPSGKS